MGRCTRLSPRMYRCLRQPDHTGPNRGYFDAERPGRLTLVCSVAAEAQRFYSRAGAAQAKSRGALDAPNGLRFDDQVDLSPAKEPELLDGSDRQLRDQALSHDVDMQESMILDVLDSLDVAGNDIASG